MKIVGLLSVLVVAVCLVGCENAELVTCQQEKEGLAANIIEKDAQIEALKTENTKMQAKTMESITTMMTKQAAKDNELKQKLAEKTKQVKDLQTKVAAMKTQIAEHVCVVEAVEEVAEEAVDAADDAVATE